MFWELTGSYRDALLFAITAVLAAICTKFWIWILRRTREDALHLDPNNQITWCLEPVNADLAELYFGYVANRTRVWRRW
eukprot:scaffold138440_cov34-Prasinocladus_malaysianus.AAC.2